MNLSHYLKNLSRNEAVEVLNHLAPFGVKTLADVPQALLTPEVLQAILSGLNGEELMALKMIAFCPVEQGAIVEQVHQKLNSLTHKWRRNSAQVVAGLRHRGLVFANRMNYREVYYIPVDLREKLLGLFRAEMTPPLLVKEPVIEEGAGDPSPFLRNVYLFLSFVGKNPLELTQSGAIHRRQLKKFLDLIGVPDDEANLKNRFEEPYPEPFRLIYLFVLERGLIANQNGSITLKNPDAFIRLPLAEQLHDLFRFWQERFPDRYRDLRLVAPILREAGDQWVDLEALAASFDPINIAPAPRDSFFLRLRSMCFHHLAYLGLIRLGHAGTREVCRLTEVGLLLLAESELPENLFASDLYVQPNFEILAPRNLRPDLLWKLEQIADLERPDQMMSYRLSKDSIFQALSAGSTGEEILSFLSAHSRTPLPQNVEYSIRQWSESFGRIYFLQAFLLHCDSEVLAAEIKASRRLKPFILGELTPVDLAVDGERYQEMLQVLREEGYLPKPGIRYLGKDG